VSTRWGVPQLVTGAPDPPSPPSAPELPLDDAPDDPPLLLAPLLVVPLDAPLLPPLLLVLDADSSSLHAEWTTSNAEAANTTRGVRIGECYPRRCSVALENYCA
jgi:hypothetical protein